MIETWKISAKIREKEELTPGIALSWYSYG
jgi:hypothetical protein